jgi:hypothetical protein
MFIFYKKIISHDAIVCVFVFFLFFYLLLIFDYKNSLNKKNMDQADLLIFIYVK